VNAFAPVALWGFWLLLAAGWWVGALRVKGTAVFLLLWLAGFFGSRYVPYPTLWTSYVAVLDIPLVFVVFEGDVRLK
jgi:hypothetical protein